nr:hypothetical protein GCM10010200_088670 [Actinomadura rugatobispora]
MLGAQLPGPGQRRVGQRAQRQRGECGIDVMHLPQPTGNPGPHAARRTAAGGSGGSGGAAGTARGGGTARDVAERAERAETGGRGARNKAGSADLVGTAHLVTAGRPLRSSAVGT